MPFKTARDILWIFWLQSIFQAANAQSYPPGTCALVGPNSCSIINDVRQGSCIGCDTDECVLAGLSCNSEACCQHILSLDCPIGDQTCVDLFPADCAGCPEMICLNNGAGVLTGVQIATCSGLDGTDTGDCTCPSVITTVTPTSTSTATSTSSSCTAQGYTGRSLSCQPAILAQCADRGGVVQAPGPITTNGCGPSGKSAVDVLISEGLNALVPRFKGCCNAHDICFGTCATDSAQFARCNNAIRACLTDVCKSNITPNSHRERCLVEAEIVYGGVSEFGCGAYDEAQNHGCKCAC